VKNISVSGMIAIARYGQGFRGNKAKLAEEKGNTSTFAPSLRRLTFAFKRNSNHATCTQALSGFSSILIHTMTALLWAWSTPTAPGDRRKARSGGASGKVR
jgi:hypothetical protein